MCPDCGVLLTGASGADEDEDEDEDTERTLSIEFTLLSGETISVRDELDEDVTEQAVREYARRLIQEIGTDVVRTFAYWWENEFYVDAVRLREVAAVSVSTVSSPEEDADDWNS
jgi:hypothetical protein